MIILIITVPKTFTAKVSNIFSLLALALACAMIIPVKLFNLCLEDIFQQSPEQTAAID